ncbi:MAG: hypothetical protein RLZZ60_1941, partial [Bacteroidota bacterium]
MFCSMNFKAIVALFVLTSNTFLMHANNSGIKGIVVDPSKKVLSDVSVELKNQKTIKTNSKGEFEFEGLSVGFYSITIKLNGYDNKTIDSIQVIDNSVMNLGQIVLKEKIENKRGARVTFKKPQTTVAAGVQEQKKNESVTNVITSASIAKSNDGDAAKVAARVPGVTLMENRFIMLRGLSQRYNSVQINNINAPSTETDRRAFSFDLIPSNMLDKMSIYKSPSSDLSGDFAGGVIKLLTKNEMEKDFVTYSFGLGFRVNTTFKSHMNNSVQSSTDYLGFDNG